MTGGDGGGPGSPAITWSTATGSSAAVATEVGGAMEFGQSITLLLSRLRATSAWGWLLASVPCSLSAVS
jgi:hypothetical protein